MSCIARRRFSLLPAFLRRRLDPFEAAIDTLLREAGKTLQPGQRVLDAGAGESQHAHYFQGARYVAVDLCVGDARWDYGRLDAVADLHRLPFPSGCFDALVCIVVLEHVVDPLAVLREFKRVLRAGARLYLATPLLWEEHQKPHDYYRFTSDGLRELLRRAGFQGAAVQAVGGFFWVLGRRCINGLTFFQQGWRWPLFLLLAPFFGFLLPLICNLLDPLDSERRFTLGHTSVASG